MTTYIQPHLFNPQPYRGFNTTGDAMLTWGLQTKEFWVEREIVGALSDPFYSSPKHWVTPGLTWYWISQFALYDLDGGGRGAAWIINEDMEEQPQ